MRSTPSPPPLPLSETFEVCVERLRQQVNAATTLLAMNKMIDETAVQALAEALQETARAAYTALQTQEPPPFDVHVNDGVYEGGEEWVPVAPVQVPDTVARQLNPVQFSCPFIVAPFGGGEMMEYHFAATCAVAVYNLGLSLHNQVYQVERGNDELRTLLLEQAKDLYLQGHALLNPLDINPEGTLIQVYLACCNNLAEVYHQLKSSASSSSSSSAAAAAAAAAQEHEREMKDWQQTLGQALWSIPPAKKSAAYVHFWNVCNVYGVRP